MKEMKEFIEKLIGRLEEEKDKVPVNRLLDDIIKDKPKELGQIMAYNKSIKIAKELAEEYRTSLMETLVEARKNCSEDSDCSECPFGQIEDRCILAELQIDVDNKKSDGWTPCSKKLPEKKGAYLVMVKDFGMTIAVFSEVENNMHVDENIVAWHSLPEPYKENKKN